MYNIQLNSPQLAYQQNMKKYYKTVIYKNNKIFNRKFKPYTPLYFQTSYDRIYYPNISNVPY
jgi:hypothetical protein